MLETEYFKFDRTGIITFFRRITAKELKSVFNMCVAHAKKNKTRKPYDWQFIPLLTVAV